MLANKMAGKEKVEENKMVENEKIGEKKIVEKEKVAENKIARKETAENKIAEKEKVGESETKCNVTLMPLVLKSERPANANDIKYGLDVIKRTSVSDSPIVPKRNRMSNSSSNSRSKRNGHFFDEPEMNLPVEAEEIFNSYDSSRSTKDTIKASELSEHKKRRLKIDKFESFEGQDSNGPNTRNHKPRSEKFTESNYVAMGDYLVSSVDLSEIQKTGSEASVQTNYLNMDRNEKMSNFEGNQKEQFNGNFMSNYMEMGWEQSCSFSRSNSGSMKPSNHEWPNRIEILDEEKHDSGSSTQQQKLDSNNALQSNYCLTMDGNPCNCETCKRATEEDEYFLFWEKVMKEQQGYEEANLPSRPKDQSSSLMISNYIDMSGSLNSSTGFEEQEKINFDLKYGHNAWRNCAVGMGENPSAFWKQKFPPVAFNKTNENWRFSVANLYTSSPTDGYIERYPINSGFQSRYCEFGCEFCGMRVRCLTKTERQNQILKHTNSFKKSQIICENLEDDSERQLEKKLTEVNANAKNSANVSEPRTKKSESDLRSNYLKNEAKEAVSLKMPYNSRVTGDQKEQPSSGKVRRFRKLRNGAKRAVMANESMSENDQEKEKPELGADAKSSSEEKRWKFWKPPETGFKTDLTEPVVERPPIQVEWRDNVLTISKLGRKNQPRKVPFGAVKKQTSFEQMGFDELKVSGLELSG